MFKSSIIITTVLALLTTSVGAQTNFVHTGITRSSSEPSDFHFVNSTVGPLTDSAIGPFSSIYISSDYGLLTANVDNSMPALADNGSNPSATAEWFDTLTFNPSNNALIGAGADARFTFTLQGNWSHNFASGADGSSIQYDVDLNGSEYSGYYASLSGPTGELNPGNLSSLVLDQSINLGTPFTLTISLADDSILHSVTDGTSFATTHFTLAETGVQVLDINTDPVAGTWSTQSGHDYTVSAIPEPAAWFALPGLAAFGAATIRRKIRGT